MVEKKEQENIKEPISVYPPWYPSGRPNTVSAVHYYACMVLFIIGNALTMLALVLFQIPSLLIMYCCYPYLPFCDESKREIIKIWFYKRYRSYIKLSQMAWGSWITILTYAFLPGKMFINYFNLLRVFYGDHKEMGEIAQSIVMANHQIFPDCIFW